MDVVDNILGKSLNEGEPEECMYCPSTPQEKICTGCKHYNKRKKYGRNK